MQTSLTPKLAMAEVATDSPYVTAAPVLPELTPDNAATRYVFVPASQFQAEGIGGYVARCTAPFQHTAAPTGESRSHACAASSPGGQTLHHHNRPPTFNAAMRPHLRESTLYQMMVRSRLWKMATSTLCTVRQSSARVRA